MAEAVMDPRELTLHVQYLQGLVTGLQSAVKALIQAHPDPEHAAGLVSRRLEVITARGLASPTATDAMLQGLSNSHALLVPAGVAVAAPSGAVEDAQPFDSTALDQSGPAPTS